MRQLLTVAGVLAPIALLTLGLRLLLALIPVEVEWPQGLLDHRSVEPTPVTVAAPEEDYVLVLGGSSVYSAFEQSELGLPARKQTFRRGYATDVAIALAWDWRQLPAERRPAHVVWGLNVASLVDRGDAQSTAIAKSFLEPEQASRLQIAASRLGLIDQLHQHYLARDPWFRLREPLKDWLVLRLRPLVGRSGSPQLPRPENYARFGKQHDPERTRRNNEAWARLGVFAEAPLDDLQVRGVEEVMALCREADVQLTLISMPEHSTTRDLYSPQAREAFEALLNRAPLLDLWRSIPDSGFKDQGHLNKAGRVIATRLLEEYLASPNRTQ